MGGSDLLPREPGTETEAELTKQFPPVYTFPGVRLEGVALSARGLEGGLGIDKAIPSTPGRIRLFKQRGVGYF